MTANPWTYGALAALTLLACDEPGSKPTETDDPPPATTAPSTLSWAPCGPRVPSGLDGECASAEVPIRWSEGGAPVIEVSVKRFLADSPQGQVWLLDGGPGGNGWEFESAELYGTGRALVDDLRARGWDVYVPSHRGTGLSTPLRCPPYQDWDSADGPYLSPDELGPCADDLLAEWGEDLSGFNSVEAAQDVLALAGRVAAEDGGRQALYSISYGGYWAQRTMKHDPGFWDAIVLDSPLVLGADVEHTDLYAGRAVDRLFSDVCGLDPQCTAYLGDDPLQTALDVLAALEAGAGCPGLDAFGLDADRVVWYLQVMVGSFPDSRVMAPPMIHRLSRCSESDVAELEHMVAFLEGVGGGTTSYAPTQGSTTTGGDPAVVTFNLPLSNNVIALDLWPVDLDIDALREETLAEPFALFSTSFAEMLSQWPRPDDYLRDDALPVSDSAVLITQGGLDMATTPEWSASLAEQLDGPQQRRVVFPLAGHDTLFWTTSTSCALSIQLDFLDDPTVEPLLDCIEEQLDFDSDSVAYLASMVFGTSSLWGS
jgi:pimeloyl-ACP methyl ester carboxylesterase